MIDLTKIRYDLVAITPQGKELHLFEIRKSLSWEEPPGEIAARLSAGFLNVKFGEGMLHEQLAFGTPIFLFADWGEGWQEVYRGTIWKKSNPNQLGEFHIAAYDLLKYCKSRDDRFYPAGRKGTEVIKDICKDWKIPMGQIDGPAAKMPKLAFRRYAISEMFLEVLEHAEDKDAGGYVLRASKGKLECIKMGSNKPVMQFDANIITGLIDDQETIENLVTRVKIIGSAEDDQASPVLKTMDGDTRFGIIQDIVIQADADDAEEAVTSAKRLLRVRGKPERGITVPAPDVPFARKGDKVHLESAALNGYYFIKGIYHDADSTTMQMEVEA